MIRLSNDIIAFRRMKRGGAVGQPWESKERQIYSTATINHRDGHTLERIENPVLVTPEMIGAVKVFTDGQFLMGWREYPDAVNGLRSAFASVFFPLETEKALPPNPVYGEPEPEPEKKTMSDVFQDGQKALPARPATEVESLILDTLNRCCNAIDALARRVDALEKGSK